MRPRSIITSIFCFILCLSSCVEHRGIVLTDSATQAHDIHIFQDGRLLIQENSDLNKKNENPDSKEQANFSNPLPSEMHVDAWYRDEQGLIYRSHLHLLSPRPWWQRFPSDLFTDALWPKTFNVDATGTLIFKPIESLEPSYLDELADVHGYGKGYARSE